MEVSTRKQIKENNMKILIVNTIAGSTTRINLDYIASYGNAGQHPHHIWYELIGDSTETDRYVLDITPEELDQVILDAGNKPAYLCNFPELRQKKIEGSNETSKAKGIGNESNIFSAS